MWISAGRTLGKLDGTIYSVSSSFSFTWSTGTTGIGSNVKGASFCSIYAGAPVFYKTRDSFVRVISTPFSGIGIFTCVSPASTRVEFATAIFSSSVIKGS